jgi:hypothetical protein
MEETISMRWSEAAKVAKRLRNRLYRRGTFIVSVSEGGQYGDGTIEGVVEVCGFVGHMRGGHLYSELFYSAEEAAAFQPVHEGPHDS